MRCSAVGLLLIPSEPSVSHPGCNRALHRLTALTSTVRKHMDKPFLSIQASLWSLLELEIQFFQQSSHLQLVTLRDISFLLLLPKISGFRLHSINRF